MTATVGGLLDDVHALAWQVASLASRPTAVTSTDWVAGLMAAWPRFAAATVHTVDAAPLELGWREDAASVRAALVEVASGRAWWKPVPGLPADDVRPDAMVQAMGVRLGAVGDLLAGQPTAHSEADRVAALGVQADVLAPVHAVAVATVAALQHAGGVGTATAVLGGVAARTEPFALVPSWQRIGRYRDVAAVASGDDSLDAVFASWVPATVGVLGSQHRVTGTALQVAAGDVLIVTAAAATVCAAASELGMLERARTAQAVSALAAAHDAWRAVTVWPATVRLDGVRDVDHTHASRVVRATITNVLRQDRGWLSPDAMADRLDVPGLVASMRRGMHGAAQVGLAHFQAIENLVRGTGQLWIAAEAVTEVAYQSAAVVQAACQRGWVPLPRRAAPGVALLQAARTALDRTLVALAAVERVTGAPQAEAQLGHRLEWEQGRIVARRPATPSFETVAPIELSGRRAERRAVVAPRDRPRCGPRP